MAGTPGAAVAEVRNGVAWIALDRPEKRNALSVEVWNALGDIGRELSENPSVRVAIVYGNGKSFCAGLDLTMLSSPGGMLGADVSGAERESSDRGPIEASIARLQESFSWLATAPFPTIAAVHGHALGAGWQLALSCDFVVAAKGTLFGMLETNYGLIPDMGGTARLVRSAGVAAAKYFVLTGKKVIAEELLPLGLVAEVVEEGELLKRAEELATDIIDRSPTALRAAKRLIEDAFVVPVQEALEAEATAQQQCMTSPHFLEAVSAFVQKRKPDFTTR
jgi:enoyl-CoA hydratase/carnithine racemase